MEDIYTILPKYFNNQCTADELKAVKSWKKENPVEFKEHQKIWKLTEKHEYIDFDHKVGWQELQPQLKGGEPPTKVVSMNKWAKFAAAAIVILISTFGIMQFLNPAEVDESGFAENGINLDYASTTRGTELVTKKIVEETSLKSGDKIWLNKNTKVEDVGREDGRYEVKVHKGEAFFDVKSRKDNPEEPFLVHTQNAAVSVIGTEFSVASRKNKTIIRVVEGTVKVITSDIEQISLTVGEQAMVVDGAVEKIDAYSPNFLAWKTGKFEFEDTPIATVAILLETFYQAKIEVVEGTTGSTNGAFDNKEIDEILGAISLSSGLKLTEVEAGKHYTISN